MQTESIETDRYANFERHADGIDVTPFLSEITVHADEWERHTGRQRYRVQRETQTIYLRGPRMGILPLPLIILFKLKVEDSHATWWIPGARARFKAITQFLKDFAKTRDAKLARATIVRLKPGGRVYEHIDIGDYYPQRDRYHLVLQSKNGSVLTAGDEQVMMQTGEIWWFDNKKKHSAHNPSDDWRIHVIFDLEPRKRH
jgi:hypothetical protein